MDENTLNQDSSSTQPQVDSPAVISPPPVETSQVVPEQMPPVLNFVSNEPVETPKRSPLVLIVLLVIILGGGAFYMAKGRASSFSAFPASSTAPTDWLSIDTKVGTMKYPANDVKIARTNTNGVGALILYTNGRTLSLLGGTSSLEADEEKDFKGIVKRMKSTQTVSGRSWRIYETLWTYSIEGSPKQYSARAYTEVSGITYTLDYEQGEAGALAGGSALNDTAVSDARITFANILAGVDIQ